jgi:uncharacterized membrane protein YhaH (DUF805 family)
MSALAEAIHSLAVTLWVGALWAVGLMVVPTLFRFIPDQTVAGSIAGRLFLYTALLGLLCGAYLLLFRLVRFGTHAGRQAFFWVTVTMVLLTVVGQFAVHPILESLREQALARQVLEGLVRERFAVWHGVASVLYVIECALGVALVALQAHAPS